MGPLHDKIIQVEKRMSGKRAIPVDKSIAMVAERASTLSAEPLHMSADFTVGAPPELAGVPTIAFTATLNCAAVRHAVNMVSIGASSWRVLVALFVCVVSAIVISLLQIFVGIKAAENINNLVDDVPMYVFQSVVISTAICVVNLLHALLEVAVIAPSPYGTSLVSLNWRQSLMKCECCCAAVQSGWRWMM